MLLTGFLLEPSRASTSAFKGFYRRTRQGQSPGYPRFKGRERFRTLQLHSGKEQYVKVGDPETGKGVVRIKGLPALRFKCARIPGGQQPKDIKITLKPNGKVWLSMSFEFDADAVSVKKDGDPRPRRGLPTAPVGVDMGVNKRAALSCGEQVLPRRDNTAHRRKARSLIRRMQRQRDSALAEGRARHEPRRRGDGSLILGKDGRPRFNVVWLDADGKPGPSSRRYQKTLAQRRRMEMREEVRSRNELHKWTANIVRRHDFIAVEDLTIRNMTTSAAGTVEDPGERVAQKRGLNRSILDQQWGKAITYLEYKAESAGIPFICVDPKNTSRACAGCGAVVAGARVGESFVCTACGNMDDADNNAALNILARGWNVYRQSNLLDAAEPLPLGSPGARVHACASSLDTALPIKPRTRASPDHRQLAFAL